MSLSCIKYFLIAWLPKTSLFLRKKKKYLAFNLYTCFNGDMHNQRGKNISKINVHMQCVDSISDYDHFAFFF